MQERFNEFEEEGFDLKKWAAIFLRHWSFLLVGVLIALSSVCIVYLFSSPIYELRAHVLVNKDNDPLDKAEIFSSAFSHDPYQLNNEIGVLKSKAVTRRTIQQLDFSISYFLRKRFVKQEKYGNLPFTVVIDSSHLQPIETEFLFKLINDSLIAVSAMASDVVLYDYSRSSFEQKLGEFRFEDTIQFGQITGNSYCRFTIYPQFEYLKTLNKDGIYSFIFHSQQSLVQSFRNFSVVNERGSSILTITFRYGNKQKAAHFLNTLVKIYLRKGVERDNQIAQATIQFIDNQLTDIVDSLESSGMRLQDFKAANKVLDIGVQAEKVYSKIEKLEVERARLLVQKRYFTYLLENLQSKSDVSDLISPSSIDIDDPILSSLIIELADLYTERAEMSFNSIKDNPYLQTLEMRIEETKRKLTDAARNILHTNEIAIEEKNTQIAIAEQNLNRLPGDQQKLLSIERKFKLNDDLYTYLLTRRSDMEIFYASNLPASDILDFAEVEDAKVVSPNLKSNILIALFLGLFFPGAFIYFRETFNSRIRNQDDIRKLSLHPILGQVFDTKIIEFPAVLNHPDSLLTESYRTLRTNLQFVIDESNSNVILISSAVQGEGKSFTALNLSSVYSFYGKKTVLIDFDLRKSQIQSNLGLNTESGLSNYLSNNSQLDQVIFRSDKINFDVIPSGPIPPNPSELVASQRTGELFRQLRKSYDIIIVDSPPIGIVSDGLLLYSEIDILLLVVRYNFTRQEMFRNVIDNLNARNIDKVAIILNDINFAASRYGYGYGYNHSDSSSRKNSRSLFRRRPGK